MHAIPINQLKRAVLLRLAYGIHSRVKSAETEAPLMAPNPKDQKWYSLAEQASKEMNQTKLMSLVAQLCDALDERIIPHSVESDDAKASGGMPQL
jgi:hypothetical protein